MDAFGVIADQTAAGLVEGPLTTLQRGGTPINASDPEHQWLWDNTHPISDPILSWPDGWAWQSNKFRMKKYKF